MISAAVESPVAGVRFTSEQAHARGQRRLISKRSSRAGRRLIVRAESVICCPQYDKVRSVELFIKHDS